MTWNTNHTLTPVLPCSSLTTWWRRCLFAGFLGMAHMAPATSAPVLELRISLREPGSNDLRARFVAKHVAETPDPIGFLQVAARKKITVHNLTVEVRSPRELSKALLQMREALSSRRLPLDVRRLEVTNVSTGQQMLLAERFQMLRDGRMVLDGDCSAMSGSRRIAFNRATLHPQGADSLTLRLETVSAEGSALTSIEIAP